MGAYLSAPITDKDSSDGEGPTCRWGASGMQGWRKGMEDAHITVTNFGGVSGVSTAPFAPRVHGSFALPLARALPSRPAPHNVRARPPCPSPPPPRRRRHLQDCLFGVFDGHGGQEVATFCEHHMPEVVLKNPGACVSCWGGCAAPCAWPARRFVFCYLRVRDSAPPHPCARRCHATDYRAGAGDAEATGRALASLPRPRVRIGSCRGPVRQGRGAVVQGAQGCRVQGAGPRAEAPGPRPPGPQAPRRRRIPAAACPESMAASVAHKGVHFPSHGRAGDERRELC